MSCQRHIMVMKTWSASAVGRYYGDPVIAFLPDGYYIVPHCDPDCCRAFGGVSTADFGPFATRRKARNWSRKNLVMNG